jgi:hypothetical protein
MPSNMYLTLISVIILVINLITPNSGSYVEHSFGHYASIHGGFTIDDNRYTLTWDVNHGWITFTATARTAGFVGFGISPGAVMEIQDLFVAGMYENGTVYGQDLHAGAAMDAMNNYVLYGVSGDMMYTMIHFGRPLATGDDKEDVSILNEEMNVFWLVGPPMDEIKIPTEPENQGMVKVNLLNPPMFHNFRKSGAAPAPA